MYGQMMDTPLLITSLIRFANQCHGDTEIVSRTTEGPIHRYTYADSYRRICQLGHALQRLGVKTGDRVATLAWNNHRHFELYFGISGIGAVCHTINPRLPGEQIAYILNHAEDSYLFLDTTFQPLAEALAKALPKVKGFVFMTDAAHMPQTKLSNALCYETLLEGEATDFDWPEFDERTASSLCYTSGTTGHPKGALYSHRSTVLHTFAVSGKENLGCSSQDVTMPLVPMFHVNAWGVPYAAAMNGAKLVLPGPGYTGEAIYELLDGEKVTNALGVPTIWFMLFDYIGKSNKMLPHLKKIVVGGSAAPRAMVEAFEKKYEVEVFHAWGMTEMSPVGTTGNVKRKTLEAGVDAVIDAKCKQGRAMFGVDMRIVDADGKALPHDGEAFGELLVRGPWIISGYFNDEAATKAAITEDGWFRTGDVAKIDADGNMQIVDRSKDVIKSGGEWISSIDVENIAVGHPEVAEAAVIAMPHPRWSERPLLVVVPTEGATPSRDALLSHLAEKMPKWWLPDDVVFVEELPHTATGKISKLQLRDQFKDYTLPTA